MLCVGLGAGLYYRLHLKGEGGASGRPVLDLLPAALSLPMACLGLPPAPLGRPGHLKVPGPGLHLLDLDRIGCEPSSRPSPGSRGPKLQVAWTQRSPRT